MEKIEAPESPRRIRRRERLKQLLAEEGGPAEVSRIVDTPRSHFSAITNGSRGLGDALAAKLEQAFGKPAGWFDEVRPDPVEVDMDSHPDLAPVRTVRLKLQAGVSGFAVEPIDDDGPPIFFRNDWLRQRGYKPYNLLALKIGGMSMIPTLWPDDMVVVHTADTEPKDGEVYAVNYEGESVIKRMKRERGSWWLSSDNADKARYPDKECLEGSCFVIGHVIHRQSERI